MNTVSMFVIMGLICRFKAPGGGFRNLKFDLLYTHKACNFKHRQPKLRLRAAHKLDCSFHAMHNNDIGNI